MLPGSFDFRSRPTTPTPPGGLPGLGIISNDLKEQANQYGLLVTAELDIAVQRCKSKVEKLAAECRRGNRRYRDIDFDFIEDQDLCLHGLSKSSIYSPSDVLRVTQIFDNPKFFVDGATSGDLAQGAIGDCWFISAMAIVASAGLIEKICVARDEQVGIYGFIFWRDCGWVDVIIDDLLFTKVPRFEELSAYDQGLYQDDRDQYNRTARKGSKTLYFARSRTDNETWVPLLEKAYAKLHGDYASLEGGYTRQAVEDLTGSVSTLIHVQDILDIDRFWNDELMKTKDDRLFACFTRYYDHCQVPAGVNPIDDSDFLSVWGLVEKNHIFDDSWVVSSLWVKVDAGEHPRPWSFGDISYQISIPKATSAIIVLAQLDTRYFDELAGCYMWSLDFTVSKKGDGEVLGSSYYSSQDERSVKLEVNLEEGEYVVHVRLERMDRWDKRSKTYITENIGSWDMRKYSKKRVEYTQSHSIAANFDPTKFNFLTIPAETYPGKTVTEIELEALAQVGAKRAARKAAFEPEPEPEPEKPAEEKKPEEKEEEKKDEKKADEPEVKVKDTAIPVVTEPPKDGADSSSSEIVIVEKTDTEGSAPAKSDEKDAESKPSTSASKEPPSADSEEKKESDKDGAEKKEDGKDEKKEGDKEEKKEEKKEEGKSADEKPSTDATPPVVAKPEPPKLTHFGVMCSGCKGNIDGELHYCTHVSCVSFTLCEKCMKRDVHEKDHIFLKLELPEDTTRLTENPGGENDSLVVGLRVYTHKSSPAIITAQLRHGNIIRHAVTAPRYL
ncbi:hypothetical protein FRC02_008704 [Tulasnella sp. 418]|nr:hypothetical protein FRC02_008704 [Tulasnella sp. 418]